MGSYKYELDEFKETQDYLRSAYDEIIKEEILVFKSAYQANELENYEEKFVADFKI